ncbi:FBP domain-containing protein [Agrococcus versicolor]
MHALDQARLRALFVNVSQRERAAIPMPGIPDPDWANLEYLGWRDAKRPRAGYLVAEVDGEPVGIVLAQVEQPPRARPQCAWCDDVTLPNDVVGFSARRAGAAGKRGDSVGTLACARFECSVNVRRQPTIAYVGFDVHAAVERRIRSLAEHVEAFARAVRDGR